MTGSAESHLLRWGHGPRALGALSVALTLFSACGGDNFSGKEGSGGATADASADTGGTAGSAAGSSGAAGSSAAGEAGVGGSGASAGTGAAAGDGGGAGTTAGAGGDSGSSGIGGGAGDGGAGGNGASAGSGGTGGTTYTLENFCTTTAPRICAARKACCEAHFGYDEAKCRSTYITDCAADAQGVISGEKTFHPEYIEQCAEALDSLYRTCEPTVLDGFEIFDGMRACALVFQGMKTQGQNCGRSSDCKQSADPNVAMTCGGLLAVFNLGTCRRNEALPEGRGCEVGLGANPAVCRPGLWCDISLDVGVGTQPYQGTCQPAPDEGKPCTWFGGFDVQCGTGFYCSATSGGACTASHGGGTPCSAPNECQTTVCGTNPQPGVCTPTIPSVTPRECRGAG